MYSSIPPSGRALGTTCEPVSERRLRWWTGNLQAIGILYEQYRLQPTVRVKRELWELLLGAALGEIRGVNLDGLFVRHTYLVAVIGMITQAAFGLDLHERAVNDPRDLIVGETFRQKTGLVDVIESDFFSWIVEVPDAAGTIRLIADHVGGYTWETDTSASLAPFLYETIIPADERKQLGEYYTPRLVGAGDRSRRRWSIRSTSGCWTRLAVRVRSWSRRSNI